MNMLSLLLFSIVLVISSYSNAKLPIHFKSYDYNFSYISTEITDSNIVSQENLECIACETLIRLSKALLRLNSMPLKTLLKTICTLFKIETSEICSKISDLMSPHVFYILKHSNLSSSEICQISLQQCDDRKYSDIFTTSLELTELHENKNNHTLDSINMLWISDTHIDDDYEIGRPSYCNEPLCCRNKSKSVKHVNSLSGKWGSIGFCDIPERTIVDMLKNVKTQKLDYLLFTGDIPPHDIWNENKVLVNEKIMRLLDLFDKYLYKQDFILAIGNHEATPINLFSPLNVPKPISTYTLYQDLYERYLKNIPYESKKYFLQGGYYWKDISADLRIIVLNTNTCARLNFWLWYKDGDLDNQLQWLENVLHDAYTQGKFVHIVGHIPPDLVSCDNKWFHYYIQIIRKYKNIIKGQFFAHTHVDEFRLYYHSSEQIPFAFSLIGGSLTTYEEVNPNYKIVNMLSNGDIMDVETYTIDIEKENEITADNLIWFKEYSMIDTYHLPKINLASMSNLYKRLSVNNILLDQFYQYYHRNSTSKKWLNCTLACKKAILKTLKVTDPTL